MPEKAYFTAYATMKKTKNMQNNFGGKKHEKTNFKRTDHGCHADGHAANRSFCGGDHRSQMGVWYG